MNKQTKRLTSLDFFRGATVAAMIMVNDPGSWEIKYHQLSHAEWEGCTMTDLIFPFFLFIVGVAISLSFGKAIQKGLNKNDLFIKTIKRSAIIFSLGLFLNLIPEFNFGELRIPGVLQRIAIVFLFCSFIFLYASKRNQYLWFGGILLGYYVLMMFVPVPGIGAANLEPEHNFSAWFDRLILNGYLGKKGSGSFDITGIFTSIPAIASGLSGVLVGHLLAEKKFDENVKLIWMFVAGSGMMLTGWIFSFEFPIIKKLWTSSYVLYTSGIATIAFAVSYWFLDVLQYLRFTKPFLAFGMNALIAYFAAALIGTLTGRIEFMYNGEMTSVKTWVYNDVLSSVLNPHNASFAYSIINVAILFIPVWWMYKRKIIIKV